MSNQALHGAPACATYVPPEPAVRMCHTAVEFTGKGEPIQMTQTETKPEIVAYLKPVCGWSNGVRAVLRKYNLDYEDKDIINDRSNYSEMVRKSGQPLSPCIEIDGEMLADVSGQEVEQYLVEKGLVRQPAGVQS